ncbi:MAG TPA: DUF4439 domain-containing protein [Cellulomonas sp.]
MHRALAAVLAAATVLALTGCDLRRETADPAEPVPDTAELVRRDAVEDAVALDAAAQTASVGAPEAVLGVLTLVSGTATEQVTLLGGVYDSGLPEATPTASTTRGASGGGTDAVASPSDVLVLLAGATADARTGALEAEDGGLARLLASVAASRAQLSTRLAGALGVDAPAVDTSAPAASTTTGGAADGSGSGDGSTASPTTATSPGGSTSPAAGAGLTRSTQLALAAAEDQAGYGFEVAAARLADTDRAAAVASAGVHRALGDTWAAQAGVVGTADDPRRVTYALGADLSTTAAVRTFCGGLESALATAYADALVGSTAGSDARTALVDALRQAAVAALAWDATPTATPGLAAVVPADAPSSTATDAAAG